MPSRCARSTQRCGVLRYCSAFSLAAQQAPTGTFLYTLANVKRARGVALDRRFLYLSGSAGEILVHHKHDGSFAHKFNFADELNGPYRCGKSSGLAVDEQWVFVTHDSIRVTVLLKHTGE